MLLRIRCKCLKLTVNWIWISHWWLRVIVFNSVARWQYSDRRLHLSPFINLQAFCLFNFSLLSDALQRCLTVFYVHSAHPLAYPEYRKIAVASPVKKNEKLQYTRCEKLEWEIIVRVAHPPPGTMETRNVYYRHYKKVLLFRSCTVVSPRFSFSTIIAYCCRQSD